MAHVPAEHGTAAGVGNHPGREAAGPQEFQLLRFTHIFASVVREFLEARLLHQVFPNSLTPTQFHLLKTVTLEGGRQMSDVAEFLGVSMPAGTKVIDKFERLGLIRRTRGKADRRVRVISASPRGRKLIRDYEKLVAAQLAAILPLFTSAEMNDFTLMLERFSLELARPGRNGAGTCVWCAGYWAPDCPVGALFGGCPFLKFCTAKASAGGPKERTKTAGCDGGGITNRGNQG